MTHPIPDGKSSSEQATQRPWLIITSVGVGSAVLAALTATAVTAGIVGSTKAGRAVPVPSAASPNPVATNPTVPIPSVPSSLPLPTLPPDQANTATCTVYDRAEDLIREADQSDQHQAGDLYQQAAARLAAPGIAPGTTPVLADMVQALNAALTALADATVTSDPNRSDIGAAVQSSDHAVANLCSRLAPGR